jgi:dethiobiotin synthetase
VTRRFYVTGTDTDVGKTVVAAGLARALARRGGSATVVKIAQTGVARDEVGDAQTAGEMAGCRYEELARFAKPADPWSAALAAGAPPLRAFDLAARIQRLDGALVVEGSGGAAVPLNERETISDVALWCGLDALLVVGLRLGCVNHALLTLEFLERRGIAVCGAILCERWRSVAASCAADVETILAGRVSVLGTIRFDESERALAERAVSIAETLVS